jgi:hypothetical protein
MMWRFTKLFLVIALLVHTDLPAAQPPAKPSKALVKARISQSAISQELLVGFEKKPYAALEGMRNIQRMMATLNPKVSRVKVDDVIDNRFVRKLDENELIDGLYAQ